MAVVVTVTCVAVATRSPLAIVNADAVVVPVQESIVVTARLLLIDVTVTAAGLMPNWVASLVIAVFVESKGVADSAVPLVVRQVPVHV